MVDDFIGFQQVQDTLLRYAELIFWFKTKGEGKFYF